MWRMRQLHSRHAGAAWRGLRQTADADGAGDQADLAVVTDEHQHVRMPAGYAGHARVVAGFHTFLQPPVLIARGESHANQRGCTSHADIVIGSLQTLKSSLKDAGMNKDQLDWLVLHQANQRILDAAAKKLDVNPSKVGCKGLTAHEPADDSCGLCCKQKGIQA